MIDSEGAHIRYLDETRARWLLREKRATPLATRKGRIYALQTISDQQLTKDGSPANGRHYSHHFETSDNPAGVWTLKRLPESHRSMFGVPKDCLKAA